METSKKTARIARTVLMPVMAAAAVWLVAPTAQAGKVGGGDAGRCERLESESVTTCTGKGKKRVCVTEDTYCGGSGNDGSCSCDASCVAAGN